MSFPKKEFVMEPMGNLVLKDIEIHRAFSDERIKRLVSANHDIEKLHMELETIFSEFVDVYNYDKQTAVMPKPFGSFKDASQKQEWIENHLLALDFEYYKEPFVYVVPTKKEWDDKTKVLCIYTLPMFYFYVRKNTTPHYLSRTSYILYKQLVKALFQKGKLREKFKIMGRIFRMNPIRNTVKGICILLKGKHPDE